jgi:primosomal protein N' (replication factor Y)
MSTEIGDLLNPPPQNLRVLGPAEAPVPRLKAEFRYQLLIKAANRNVLKETLEQIRRYTIDNRWQATALVIDVDPLSLL